MNDLRAAFERNFAERGERGAAISLWQNGEQLCSFTGGKARPNLAWGVGTLAPIFSATKVAAAATLLLSLQRAGLDESCHVGHLWPRFPLPQLSVAQLLSHQAGLAFIEPAPDGDYRAAIERTRPAWQPPQHGYHPHSMGVILDCLMEILVGAPLASYWEQEIRQVLGLELYIGLAREQWDEVALLHAPRFSGAMPKSDFYRAYFDEASEVYRAFHCVAGPRSVREMNTPEFWRSTNPARSGFASARGLAQFYQALMGYGEKALFDKRILGALTRVQSVGDDLILKQPTSFSCGAMLTPADLFLGNGFGHAGAGGCHAFAVAPKGFSFAYVMNQMELGVLPGLKLRAMLSPLKQLCKN